MHLKTVKLSKIVDCLISRLIHVMMHRTLSICNCIICYHPHVIYDYCDWKKNRLSDVNQLILVIIQIDIIHTDLETEWLTWPIIWSYRGSLIKSTYKTFFHNKYKDNYNHNDKHRLRVSSSSSWSFDHQQEHEYYFYL